MLVPRKLAGQAKRWNERGYAMAALLVGLSVMAILATVAMPAWRQMMQREKEEELVFRGQQYARAIGLFQRKAGPGVLPPNLDVLIDQRVLRKKYLDPITGEEFLVVGPTPNVPGTGGATGGAVGGQAGAGPAAPAAPRGQTGAGIGGAAGGGPAGPVGGISGVVSKSKEQSIRIYNGRTHYNEWVFQYVPQVQAAGGVPGQPGQPAGRGRGGPQGGGPTTAPPAPSGIGGRPLGPGGPGGGGRGASGAGPNAPPFPGTPPQSGFPPR